MKEGKGLRLAPMCEANITTLCECQTLYHKLREHGKKNGQRDNMPLTLTREGVSQMTAKVVPFGHG
jgi:hypothetical protein